MKNFHQLTLILKSELSGLLTADRKLVQRIQVLHETADRQRGSGIYTGIHLVN